MTTKSNVITCSDIRRIYNMPKGIDRTMAANEAVAKIALDETTLDVTSGNPISQKDIDTLLEISEANKDLKISVKARFAIERLKRSIER